MSYGLPVEIDGSESDSDFEKEELNSDCDGDCLRRIEKKGWAINKIVSNHKEHLPPLRGSAPSYHIIHPRSHLSMLVLHGIANKWFKRRFLSSESELGN